MKKSESGMSTPTAPSSNWLALKKVIVFTRFTRPSANIHEQTLVSHGKAPVLREDDDTTRPQIFRKTFKLDDGGGDVVVETGVGLSTRAIEAGRLDSSSQHETSLGKRKADELEPIDDLRKMILGDVSYRDEEIL